MKKDTKNPQSAPQKEDPTTKKNDELQEDELNKVTGGIEQNLSLGSHSTGAGAGKVTFNP
jgi:bacteriocin-like protein